jgi:hypothetical protein
MLCQDRLGTNTPKPQRSRFKHEVGRRLALAIRCCFEPMVQRIAIQGDPMDGLRPPCINDTDAKPNLSAFADGTCSWGPASKWNKAVAPLRSVVQVCIYICIPMRFIHSQFCQDGLRTNTQREERSRFLSAGRNRFSY